MTVCHMVYNAKELILAGKKIHFLRKDILDQLRPGTEVGHTAILGKRFVKKFLDTTIVSTQGVLMALDPAGNLNITVDRVRLTPDEVGQFVRNEGFDGIQSLVDFYFSKKIRMWSGKLIHWTDKRY